MAIQKRNNIIFFIGFVLSIVLLRYLGLNQSLGTVYNLTISFAVTYLVYLVTKNLKYQSKIHKVLGFKPNDGFVSKLLENTHLLVVFFFLGFFVTSSVSFLGLIMRFIYFLLTLILLIKIVRELYEKIRQSKMKKTLNGFKLIVVLILARFFIDILHASQNLNDFIKSVTGYLDWVFVLIIILTSLTFASQNNWIHYLVRKDKRYLLWSLFLSNIFLLIFLASISVEDGETYLFYYDTMIGSPTFISSIIYLILGITVRYSITVIFSFSSSEVVEKKQTELSTLTYINNIISKSKDINQVLSVINELTKNYVGASISTIEIYADHLEESFKSVIGSDSKLYDNLKKDKNFIDAFDMRVNSLMVSSIYEMQDYYFIKNFFKSVSAFIYIPILKDDKKIGYILVLNDNEYPYEGGELEILQTFGDNLKIGVENSKLEIEKRERERLESEFQIAKKMQESLLPDSLTNTNFYELDGFSIPAEEVGGDFFDELTLKSGNKCLIQGDVSGKGIGASFFMAQIKGIAMAMAKESQNGHELLCKINSTLHGSISKNLFVTMALIEFDNQSSELSYIRAGHTPLAIFKDGEFKLLTPKGIGIGIVGSDMFDKNLEIINLSADIILCFTDGINELRNNLEQDFGFERINEIINGKNFNSVVEMNHHIKNELNIFAGEMKQHDDMTLISLLNIDK